MKDEKRKIISKLKSSRGAYLIGLVILILVFYYLVFFELKSNFQEVVAQKVYRSGQPSPKQLRDWIKRKGIRTIINLRGNTEEVTEQEQHAANELGVKMISIRFSAKRLPARYLLIDLIKAIETSEQPILVHCRSGIDRAGLASALAAIAIGNVEYESAKWQAYVPPGPWKRKRYQNRNYFMDYSHISDVFRLYERNCRLNRLSTNNWSQFKQWVIDSNSLPDIEPI